MEHNPGFKLNSQFNSIVGANSTQSKKPKKNPAGSYWPEPSLLCRFADWSCRRLTLDMAQILVFILCGCYLVVAVCASSRHAPAVSMYPPSKAEPLVRAMLNQPSKISGNGENIGKQPCIQFVACLLDRFPEGTLASSVSGLLKVI